MPSPLMHTASGFLIYRLFQNRLTGGRTPVLGLPVLLSCLALSLLPDVDSAIGFLAGNLGRFHNNASHSLFVGLMVALVFSAIASIVRGLSWKTTFAMALACYELHILMDYATVGRGVMALWPYSQDRFLSPVILFYGLHWSDGLYTIRHLWTLLSEAAVVLVFLGASRFLRLRES